MAKKSDELGGGITGVGLACLEAHPIVSTLFLGVLGGKAVTALATLISSVGTVASGIQTIGAVALTATSGVVALAGAVAGLVTWLTIAIGKMSEYYQASAQTRAQLNADQLDAVGNFGTSIQVTPQDLGFGNATGTNYFAGGLTEVGEHGGEIMNLPNGTQIIPHDISQKMTGGYTVNCPVTIQGNVIGNEDFVNYVGNAISSRVQLAISNC